MQDWQGIRESITAHLTHLELDKKVRDGFISEARTAIAFLQTNPAEGRKRLRTLAGRLNGKERRPILDLLEQVASDTAPRVEPRHAEAKNEIDDIQFDLGIVCALHDPEFKRVFELLENLEVVESEIGGVGGNHTYYVGYFNGENSCRVVLAHQNVKGMVDCSILATKMLQRWKPKFLAMVGVCGGRRTDEIELGDLVVATNSFTYLTGKLKDGKLIPEPQFGRINNALLDRLKESSEEIAHLVKRDWHGPDIRTPRVHFGTLACADVVVDGDGLFESFVSKHNRDAIAVDMESYSIFRVAELCTEYQCLPIVIKGVMDFTTGKNDDVKSLSAFASARFLYHFATSRLIS